jgi:anaerobic selenocysteine-containing dehydrogenase
LRIDFGEPEEAFEEISWDEFFEIFDEDKLAFLYQDETSNGDTSRFNKFVKRSG